MKYRVVLKRLMDGQYYARCETAPTGMVERTGASESDVLDRVRQEIEFQLEYCPCTGAARDSVDLDVRKNGAA